jgi:hypothetical protein
MRAEKAGSPGNQYACFKMHSPEIPFPRTRFPIPPSQPPTLQGNERVSNGEQEGKHRAWFQARETTIVRRDAMADFGLGLLMGGSIGLGIGLGLLIGLVYLLSERL